MDISIYYACNYTTYSIDIICGQKYFLRKKFLSTVTGGKKTAFSHKPLQLQAKLFQLNKKLFLITLFVNSNFASVMAACLVLPFDLASMLAIQIMRVGGYHQLKV